MLLRKLNALIRAYMACCTQALARHESNHVYMLRANAPATLVCILHRKHAKEPAYDALLRLCRNAACAAGVLRVFHTPEVSQALLKLGMCTSDLCKEMGVLYSQRVCKSL